MLVLVGTASHGAGAGTYDEKCLPDGTEVACAKAFASAWVVEDDDCTPPKPAGYKCYHGQIKGWGWGTVAGTATLVGQATGLPTGGSCPFTGLSECSTGPWSGGHIWSGTGQTCSYATTEVVSTLGYKPEAYAEQTCP